MHGSQEWDEYLATGIDPTGGRLGPDLDLETGEYIDDSENNEATQFSSISDQVINSIPEVINTIDDSDRTVGNPNSPQYLFFDTETTGLPYYAAIPAKSVPENWPRLVQLSWIMTDDQGNITKEMNKFIIPEGFIIPTEATRIHGITTEYADYWGEKLERVLHVFNKSLRKADYIICHNTWFDTNVVCSEMKRMNIPTTIMEKKSYCTMLAGTDLCAIEGEFRGYKWPTLQELHSYLFHRKFSDAHDALADVKAVARCFWEMRDRRYI